MIIHTNSSLETERVGEALGARLGPGDVVALRGGLGAGKTTLIRGLAHGLGITARVSSPTFTIVNEYPGATPLFHFDMYRLSGEDELFEIGWDDYLTRGGVICVEWSENTPGAMPEDAVFIDIEKTGDDTRRITVTGGPYTC